MVSTDHPVTVVPAPPKTLNIEPSKTGLKFISDDNFNSEVLTSTGLRVVFFTSHW